MDKNLLHIKSEIYDKCALKISGFKLEPESRKYDACQFKLNGLNIVSRSAKITPKKVGQFVTLWKRKENGPIAPFNETDPITFYIVNIRSKNKFGQFVFPKTVLIKKEIISTDKTKGKRGFRIYPSWVIVNNKQAYRSQKWQLNYFYEINKTTDFNKVVELYKSEKST